MVDMANKLTFLPMFVATHHRFGNIQRQQNNVNASAIYAALEEWPVRASSALLSSLTSEIKERALVGLGRW